MRIGECALVSALHSHRSVIILESVHSSVKIDNNSNSNSSKAHKISWKIFFLNSRSTLDQTKSSKLESKWEILIESMSPLDILTFLTLFAMNFSTSSSLALRKAHLSELTANCCCSSRSPLISLLLLLLSSLLLLLSSSLLPLDKLDCESSELELERNEDSLGFTLFPLLPDLVRHKWVAFRSSNSSLSRRRSRARCSSRLLAKEPTDLKRSLLELADLSARVGFLV